VLVSFKINDRHVAIRLSSDSISLMSDLTIESPIAASSTSQLLSPVWMSKLERMEIVSRKIFRGRMKGERRSSRKGQSVEFADFRNYVPGDDLRFIDWNLFARLDRLYLKLFLEEEDLHVSVIIDDTPSMHFGSPSKLWAASQIAASLGYIGLCRGDRVSLSSFQSTKPQVLRGRSNTSRMLSGLTEIHDASLPANSTSKPIGSQTAPKSLIGLNAAMKAFCSRNTGKGIIVVVSDLMDKNGYEAGLKMLLAKELDIFVIHILSPEEFSPTITGDLKLVDCEDGDSREVSISATMLARYQKTLAGFITTARDFCQRRGIAYVSTRSDASVETLIEQYLRLRGLVR
jgi:uncharacterized protein (DUF58 family)